MDAADIIALIVSLLTAGGLVWDRVTSRRKARADAQKTEADANETLRDTVMKLIDPLKKRIDELESTVEELKAENADLKEWAERLVAQVKSFGCEPAKFIRRTSNRVNK